MQATFETSNEVHSIVIVIWLFYDMSSHSEEPAKTSTIYQHFELKTKNFRELHQNAGEFR